MASTPAVTVYSTTWCGFCKMVKDYLTQKSIAFTEIDIEQDQEAAKRIVEKTKQMGVPVIEIGESTLIGFDKAGIDKALHDNKLL